MAQRSDTGFTIGVVVVALVAAGLGIFLLERRGVDSPVVIAPATNRAAHPEAVGGPPASGPSRAAAVAVVRQNAVLALHGQHEAACALESPAYQRFDALHYPQGSCAAAEEAEMSAAEARGLTLRLVSSRLVSFGHGRATVVAITDVGGQPVTTHLFLRYHRGRWWITGGDDSGDVGF